MPNAGTLTLSLRAQTGQLGPDLNKGLSLAQGYAGKVTSLMDGLSAKITGAVAGVASIAFIKSSINAFAEQETAVKRLDSVLAATKGTVGLTSEEIQNFATQMQHSTRFADELTISAASVLSTFTKIKGAQFLSGLEAAMNIATIKGMGLVEATTLVGKALNSPADGLKKLKKVGIDFDSQTKNNILSLDALGKSAEAQQVLLEGLAKVFGGAAQNDLDTYAGKIDNLSNSFGELKEKLGGVVAGPLSEAMRGWISIINELRGDNPTGGVEPQKKRMDELSRQFEKATTNKAGEGLRNSLPSSELLRMHKELGGMRGTVREKLQAVIASGGVPAQSSIDLLDSLSKRAQDINREIDRRKKSGQLDKDLKLEALFQPSGVNKARFKITNEQGITSAFSGTNLISRALREATAPKTSGALGKQGFDVFFAKQAGMIKDAQKIFEETRTPQEAAVRKLLELDRLKGVLDPQTFQRAFAAAEFNPNQAKPTHFGAATAEKGSQEALTAIARHQSQQKDPAQEALKKQDEANKALNRVDGGIKEMNKQLRGQQKLKVVEFA